MTEQQASAFFGGEILESVKDVPEFIRKIDQTLATAEECREMLAQIMGFIQEFQGMATALTAQGGPMGMLARAMIPEDEHVPRRPKLFG